MTVHVWRAATRATLQILKGHRHSANYVAFSSDSNQLASDSADKTVRPWDAATGTSLQVLKSHSSYVSAIAPSRDGKQLVSDTDKY
jgi:WD40 repeat protein